MSHYLLKLDATTRSGKNAETVADHLALRLADVGLVPRDVETVARKRPRGGRVRMQLTRDLDRTTAGNLPRQISDAVLGDGYLNGEHGGELRYVEAVVVGEEGIVAFCRMDLRP